GNKDAFPVVEPHDLLQLDVASVTFDPNKVARPNVAPRHELIIWHVSPEKIARTVTQRKQCSSDFRQGGLSSFSSIRSSEIDREALARPAAAEFA
ncbi:MAG: hypothetical protein ACRCU1_10185, partial [Alsobacter sp.]